MGGCGNINHIINLVKQTKVSGVAIASILHYSSIKKNKKNTNFKTGNTNYLNNAKEIIKI